MADKQTVEDEMYQLLDHLVQGVQEIRHKPVKDITDNKQIVNSMEHYYMERGKWIEHTIAQLNQLLIKAELKGFLTGYDCHDYPRLREYKANLENQLSEKS